VEASNSSIIESLVRALNARDFDAASRLMTQDCVHHAAGLGGGDIVGPAAWLAMVRALAAAFPDRLIRVREIVAEGERVAVRLTWTGTHRGPHQGVPATGRGVEVDGISVFAMSGGRIAEQWIEQDMLALLQQLGAAPGQSENWPPG
jgi:steroid delta-isomerase-like uncharacterized protein